MSNWVKTDCLDFGTEIANRIQTGSITVPVEGLKINFQGVDFVIKFLPF
jgi:hypothetical protein